MNPDDFRASTSGRVIRVGQGKSAYWAFVPNPLPLALIHYQFEAIHPFVDGNGRIGRLLLSLLLVHWNVLPLPLLYLSAFFEKHRQTYYDFLLAVSARGAWHEWLEFFLRGVAEQARDAILRATPPGFTIGLANEIPACTGSGSIAGNRGHPVRPSCAYARPGCQAIQRFASGGNPGLATFGARSNFARSVR